MKVLGLSWDDNTSLVAKMGIVVAVFDFDHTRFWFICALLIFPFLCFIPPDVDEPLFDILLELWNCCGICSCWVLGGVQQARSGHAIGCCSSGFPLPPSYGPGCHDEKERDSACYFPKASWVCTLVARKEDNGSSTHPISSSVGDDDERF
jgi:hypothetical protein